MNSKKKGSKWERELSKFFENWTGYKFSRTPGSGGWAKAKDSFGDVTCVDEKHAKRFPLSVEAKNYQEIKFEHILLGNEGAKILQFWEQASGDAKSSKKIPFLAMRYNNMPKGEAFVMMGKDFFNYFLENDSYFSKFKHPIMAIRLTSGEAFYIFMLSDLKSIEYKIFYKIARKYLKTLYPKE